MKICSQCQTTYTDDSLQFCLQDGTPLKFVTATIAQNSTEVWNSEPETVIKQNNNQIRFDLPQQPTTQPQNYQTNQITNFQPDPPKKSKLWLFLLVGLLGVSVIGVLGVAGVMMFMNSGTTVVQNNSNSVQTNSTNNNSANVNATPTTTPTPTPTPKPTLKPAEIESAKKEAESTIYAWKTAAENNNLDTNLSNYADTVDYYKGGKINKTKLRASKEPAYKRYDTITINVSNMKVSVDPTGEKATVTFDKEWDFTGVDKDGNEVFNTGKVNQQITLTKVNGKWKISAEKDVKVYYSDKTSNQEN